MGTGDAETRPSPWWGDFELDCDRGGRWAVGPTTVWLYRTAREWRVLYRSSSAPKSRDPMPNRSEGMVSVEEDEIAGLLDGDDDDLDVTRYSFGETEARVALEPALADRPVVARPEYDLNIPAGETVTLYMSTPLWIRVQLPETDRLLQEFPSHRMSDTWFGTSTIEGELCYATRTSGRLRLESLPTRLHRAVTPLHVQNRGQDALLMERVQLPVQHLALYATSGNTLWTQTVRMTRKEGSEGADIRIKSGAPSEAKGAEQIREPREHSSKGLFTSTFGAFGALFSTG